MSNENLYALVREVRKAANALPAGKKRDVNNKLDRIIYHLTRTKVAKTPEPQMVAGPSLFEEERHFASQTKTIYNYLMEGHRITSNDAQRIFGCARLASRICDIERQMGVTASRKRIPVTNRHGKEVWVNEYWIDMEEAQ